jgi:hypothetical protein
MPGHDDHDLERRLRDQRPVARDEFVQGLASKMRSGSHPTARPRLTLAFALSLALLVSLVAFGGVGAAKNAVSASTSSVRTAVGDDSGKSRGSKSDDESPSHKQYHGQVKICYPHKQERSIIYKEKTISQSQIAHFVAKGAVYPVPAGGCSTLDHSA